jgi:hypothetical protein
MDADNYGAAFDKTMFFITCCLCGKYYAETIVKAFDWTGILPSQSFPAPMYKQRTVTRSLVGTTLQPLRSSCHACQMPPRWQFSGHTM